MEESAEYGTLGDAVKSLVTVPREYVTLDLAVIDASSDFDNSALTYGPDAGGNMYQIAHRRVQSWLSHTCRATATTWSASGAGVYVLLLQAGGRYVGKSIDVERRVAEHRSGRGAAWVRHQGGVAAVDRPITPRTVDLGAWEARETIAQMMRHGFDAVRGWEWTGCAPLTAGDLDFFRRTAFGTGDLCRACGRPGHFAQRCTRPPEAWLAACNAAIAARTAACRRCGRASHAETRCYARTHVDGRPLEARLLEAGTD
jgi:hypothetical protein